MSVSEFITFRFYVHKYKFTKYRKMFKYVKAFTVNIHISGDPIIDISITEKCV